MCFNPGYATQWVEHPILREYAGNEGHEMNKPGIEGLLSNCKTNCDPAAFLDSKGNFSAFMLAAALLGYLKESGRGSHFRIEGSRIVFHLKGRLQRQYGAGKEECQVNTDELCEVVYSLFGVTITPDRFLDEIRSVLDGKPHCREPVPVEIISRVRWKRSSLA